MTPATKYGVRTALLRKDIRKIAQRNLAGASLMSMAKEYQCSRFLIIRIMHQELPEDFWAERARRRARIGKLRETPQEK